MTNRLNRRQAATVIAGALAAPALGGRASAQAKEVVIGAIFPFSGAAAQVGVDARHAIETAVDIVNAEHDLDLPLARSVGLPNLDGAKLRVVYADHQSDPQKGRAEAERLITQEKVVGIVGSYQSAVAATVSAVSERYSVPYLAADNSSPSLTRRNLKCIFRPGPHDEMFTQTMFDMFDMQKSQGRPVETIALFYEDTIFGSDSATAQRKLAAEHGQKIVADIKYRSSTPSLTAEVQQLKAANPQVLMPSSYTTDAILLIKTMAELGYKPQAIVAQDAGFSEQSTFDAIGPLGEGIISRSTFSLDLGGKKPTVGKVNALFKARSNKDLNDLTSRELTAALVLADAINRAKKADGAAVRDALAATDIPGDQTIMPWKRIKFDETGQNNDCTPVLLQRKNNAYVTVFPSEFAVSDLIWPGK